MRRCPGKALSRLRSTCEEGGEERGGEERGGEERGGEEEGGKEKGGEERGERINYVCGVLERKGRENH